MAWTFGETWTPDEYDLRGIVGMDGNANWLLGVNREEFLDRDDQTLVPFLVVADEAFARVLTDMIALVRDTEPGLEDVLLIEVRAGDDDAFISEGEIYPLLANLAFFVAAVDFDGLKEFREAAKTIILSSPSPVFQGMKERLILPVPKFSVPPGGWPDDTVITGVMDDGIAFAHERFRDDPASTRIYGIWDQSLPFDPLNPGFGSAFLRKEDIDGQLGKDEDHIYRDTGLIDHRNRKHKAAAWRRAHGTHVLDVAAGFPMSDGRTNRPILAVNLPTAIIAQTLGRYLDWYLFVGGYLILRWARQIFDSGAPERRVVINASFGHHSGPHDGTSLFDQLFTVLAAIRPQEPFHLVVPAGNSHMSQCYAEVDMSDGPIEFDWMVLPNDMSASFFEAWLPVGGPGHQLVLKIVTPDGVGHTIQDIPGDVVVLRDQAGTAVGLAQSKRRFGRFTLRVDIQPTDRFSPTSRPVSPSGRWHLTFQPGEKSLEEPVHVWNQRDESLYGYPRRARQSYFIHRDFVRTDRLTREIREDTHSEQAALSDCPIKRRSMINAISTGVATFTAGGYIGNSCEVARYSAGGPKINAGAMDKAPDLLMTSEDSLALPGILAAGSRSGSVVWMNGTSVAAPQLARRVANLVAADVLVTQAVIQTQTETLDPCPSKPPNPLRGGWGRLERADPRRISRFGRLP